MWLQGLNRINGAEIGGNFPSMQPTRLNSRAMQRTMYLHLPAALHTTLPGSCSCGSRLQRQHVQCQAIGKTQQVLKPPTPQPEPPQANQVAATICLLGVALLWATYSPSIRLLYDIGGAPDPTLLTAGKSCLACVFLVLALPLEQLILSSAALPQGASDSTPASAPPDPKTFPEEPGSPQQPDAFDGADSVQPPSRRSGSAADFPADFDARSISSAGESSSSGNVSAARLAKEAEALQVRPAIGGAVGALRIALNGRTRSIALASLELGAYSAAGTIAQAYGISHVTATLAGFLIQVTAVFTPCIAWAAGVTVPRRTWVACTLALVGTVVIAAEGLGGGGAGADAVVGGRNVQEQLAGSATVLGAAFCYSIATFRISSLAPNFTSVELAAGKTTGMAVVAVSVALWQLLPLLSASDGAAVDLDSLWPGHGNPTSWLLIAWAALGPGAFASVLQTFGQAHVPASRAQLIFTTIPLWSALIAITILHEPGLGALGWGGAAIIVFAGVYDAELFGK